MQRLFDFPLKILNMLQWDGSPIRKIMGVDAANCIADTTLLLEQKHIL